MPYKVSVTEKGQMTIPKKIRETLGIKGQVEVEMDQEQEMIKIKNIPDLSEVKGMIENPGQDVLGIRERMEEEYQP
ncbi:hypothetical protein AKJ56_02255 [candidate division MSBL1 archaeon SCGC-AAA382N08]|uniref:SpoVT-AbrB domain-containing protein n=1 Tax=candidate division MSBL1 archaeon SCGC-AAA382N08 TaxID=1698285 RepID=A0A133VMZ2_9EURY|nr:hypothetical protein AKJ56_02255 [candidate division MSBL1 archaeon SCGC-AAA382N08]